MLSGYLQPDVTYSHAAEVHRTPWSSSSSRDSCHVSLDFDFIAPSNPGSFVLQTCFHIKQFAYQNIKAKQIR